MDNSEIVKTRLEWMLCPDTLSPLHRKGVDEFLAFAFSDVMDEEQLPSPCRNCHFSEHKTREDMESDLLGYGMVKSYVRWIYHGEYTTTHKRARNETEIHGFDDMIGMIHDAFGDQHVDAPVDEEIDQSDEIADHASCGNESESSNLTPEQFENLLKNARKELYPGCQNFSRLSFIIKLFQIKCLDGITYKVFTNILKLFRKALPNGETLPSSYNKAMKMIRDLGLQYEKIDACENDCMLFWKENATIEQRTVCGLSRWQDSKVQGVKEGETSTSKPKKVPRKVLRYFPLKPRLQRIFMSPQSAIDMRWHVDSRVEDGILRHPADSKAWKSFDEENPLFSSDPRNVRLGLASDGFNPFGLQRSDHSTWPVVLSVYNYPPWMCTKQPYLLLSLLIPGPKAPGNNIDVYLRPLINELKELWDCGARTYDASKKEYFLMRAALHWTINDFPAYANLSGWSTKGYMACPCCGKNTSSTRLKNCGKICYMGHRRFLPLDHKWRASKAFDGKAERMEAPKPLSGNDILSQLSGFEDMKFGKHVQPPKRDDNWRKKSIFFELPYWSSLMLRHNLDVMHIEKNVFDNILGTLLDIEGKTKDHIKARHDLKELKIRKDLQPKLIDGKWHIKPASYTLSSLEKDKVCRYLEELKVPDGYSSNFAKCIKKRKISGLKTHDCHVLLEQLFPLAVRGVSCQHVYDMLVEISVFFKELCSKSLKLEDLDHLEKQIVMTLCKMEKIFLPSFFDIMVHLCVHLVHEAKMGGPVQYRWMCPIERFLRKLKCYVRNKARPEGSMAEGYILEECLLFCSKYLHDIETRYNQPERNSDCLSDDYGGLSVFSPSGAPLGKAKSKCLTEEEWRQARDYVLKNCDELQPYLREFKEGMYDGDFADWLNKHVNVFSGELSEEKAKDIQSLASGPLMGVERFTGYLANGYRFHIKELEGRRKNQNSGIMVEGATEFGNLDYYGVITEIISLQYLDGKRVVLFNCDWWDVYSKGKGVKVDKHGFITVNSRKKLKTKEPFVLASQARQVFYAKDGFDPNWLIVLKTQPRHHYDVPSTIRSSKGNTGMGMEAQQQDSSGSSHISALLISEEEGKDFDALAEKRDDIDEVIIHASRDNAPKSTNHEEELQMEEDVSEDENCLSDDSDSSTSDTE